MANFSRSATAGIPFSNDVFLYGDIADDEEVWMGTSTYYCYNSNFGRVRPDSPYSACLDTCCDATDQNNQHRPMPIPSQQHFSYEAPRPRFPSGRCDNYDCHSEYQARPHVSNPERPIEISLILPCCWIPIENCCGPRKSDVPELPRTEIDAPQSFPSNVDDELNPIMAENNHFYDAPEQPVENAPIKQTHKRDIRIKRPAPPVPFEEPLEAISVAAPEPQPAEPIGQSANRNGSAKIKNKIKEALTEKVYDIKDSIKRNIEIKNQERKAKTAKLKKRAAAATETMKNIFKKKKLNNVKVP